MPDTWDVLLSLLLPTPTLPPTPRHILRKGSLGQGNPFWDNSVKAETVVEMNNSQWLWSLIKHTYKYSVFPYLKLPTQKKFLKEKTNATKVNKAESCIFTNQHSCVISNSLQPTACWLSVYNPYLLPSHTNPEGSLLICRNSP